MIRKYFITASFILSTLFFNCNNDDDNAKNIENEIEQNIEDEIEDNIDAETFILVNTTNEEGSFIINQQGEEVYNFDLNIVGNDVNLQNDGSLVGMGRSASAQITFGGFGGSLFKQNADKSIDWQIEYTSSEYVSHHDVEYLPNGNILFLVWEKIESVNAIEAGFNGNFDIFPDAIVEMNPITQEIVWQWHVMDHIIQDHDASKANYGVIADNPNKINVNYNNDRTDGDITHANGLTYNQQNDLIYLTINYYNEVWVIDHSTSTEEAATSFGGNHNLGGDLLYRFGNPNAYDNNNIGEIVFNRVHYPNVLESGNIMVYSNQVDQGQSEAVEFKLPQPLSLTANTNNEPEVVWHFTDSNLFSRIASSAVRLNNNNTLIVEATASMLWEVTNSGEIKWQFDVNKGTIWRAYVFNSNDTAIKALGIE